MSEFTSFNDGYDEQPPFDPEAMADTSVPDVSGDDMPIGTDYGDREPAILPPAGVETSQNSEQYLLSRLLAADAELEARQQPDAFERAQSFADILGEGQQVTVPALQSLEALRDSVDPDVAASYPEAAQSMITALAAQGDFSTAERIFDEVSQRDPRQTIASALPLLEKGYPGKDDKLLQLDVSPVAEDTRPGAAERSRMLAYRYLQGMAACGTDLLDPATKGGTLLLDTIALDPSRTGRDYHFTGIVHAYAAAGHLDQATAVTELVADPYWRCTANLYIARGAVEQGDTQRAQAAFTEIQNNKDAVANCDGSCGRAGCSPRQDMQTIDLHMALSLAQQGDTAQADQLIGERNSALAPTQAKVYAEIYRQSGSTHARQQALELLQEDDGTISALGYDMTRRLAAADREWGNVMPSLDADNESVPLVCQELLARITQQPAPAADTILDDFGIDAYDISNSQNLMEIIRTIASTGAPVTAANLIHLIQSPADRIRAKAAIARILRQSS